MGSEYEEKRDFYRMAVNCEVNIEIEECSTTCTGIVQDLSANGIRFTTKDELAAGSKLHVSVIPGSNLTPALDVYATVLRCTAEGDAFTVACSTENK